MMKMKVTKGFHNDVGFEGGVSEEEGWVCK